MGRYYFFHLEIFNHLVLIKHYKARYDHHPFSDEDIEAKRV